MRVLHVGPSSLPIPSSMGGALQRRIVSLAQAQARAGAEVSIASPGSTKRRRSLGGITVWEVGLVTRRPARDYEFLLAVGRAVRGEADFDVIHAHGAPEAARLLGRRGATLAHSVDYFRYRATSLRAGRAHYRGSLSRFDVTMPVSDYCAREFSTFYPDLPTRLVTVHNGVDLEQFRPDPDAARRARAELGLPEDRRLVVYFGRVCRQKGSDLLAGLAERLRDTHADAVVVAVGPAGQFGTEGGDDLTRDLVERGVTWTGAVHEDLVRGVLSMADVVVLPTRHDEMFGMAALEALACGTPVVASDLGGIAEAVGPGGLLFPPGDVDAFAAAVVSVLDRRDLRDRLAQSGLGHARQFAWDEIAAQTARAYLARDTSDSVV